VNGYPELYALLGTRFGGDGATTFALPDLRTRLPMGRGAGPGRSPRTIGQKTGTDTVALDGTQLPQHTHRVRAATTKTTSSPIGAVPARGGFYAAPPDKTTRMRAMVFNAGKGQPHTNLQPALAVQWCSALQADTSAPVDPLIADIRAVAFDAEPRGWAVCDGRTLPINQNTALFSLLGTSYGGNGQTTFALPDLRGRVAVGAGPGPGLTNRVLGEAGGAETHQLTTQQMASHGHSVRASSDAATTTDPNLAYPAVGGSYASAPTSGSLMHQATAQLAGGGAAHPNVQPSTVLNYLICVEGIYPSRD
jgi:microcystin-dependent protein